MDVWGVDRLDDLVAVVRAALPDEGLGVDDLEGLVVEDPDPTIVLADPAGDGVALAVVRTTGGRVWASVHLVAVVPAARRRGLGRELLDGATAWSFDQGAERVVIGGGAPFYLVPGIDVRWTAGLCLAEAAGFTPGGAELNMALPTTYRAPVPPGTEVVRPLDDGAVAATLAMVDARFPQWIPEVARALAQGTAPVVREPERGAVIGVGCHSVSRAGWVGPMATDPAWRGRGVGSAALGAVCADLMAAGLTSAEICWVGPVRFYASAGAEVSRVFRSVERRR